MSDALRDDIDAILLDESARRFEKRSNPPILVGRDVLELA
jgi:hypothetical protein